MVYVKTVNSVVTVSLFPSSGTEVAGGENAKPRTVGPSLHQHANYLAVHHFTEAFTARGP